MAIQMLICASKNRHQQWQNILAANMSMWAHFIKLELDKMRSDRVGQENSVSQRVKEGLEWAFNFPVHSELVKAYGELICLHWFAATFLANLVGTDQNLMSEHNLHWASHCEVGDGFGDAWLNFKEVALPEFVHYTQFGGCAHSTKS